MMLWSQVGVCSVVVCCLLQLDAAANEPLQVATFRCDVTPPLGAPLCNGNVKPAMKIVTPLTARGLVLFGNDQPIVLCAIDWVGIGNESHELFRTQIAAAAGTSPDRVAVHTLHQHDAPGTDLATERILLEYDLGGRFSNADFDLDVIDRVSSAVKQSLKNKRRVTEIGLGTGVVDKVASNRRILGPDGRVALQRQSSGGRNPKARDAPEGTIDPLVRLIALWDQDHPVAVLTYYATHPQSYYGKGEVDWDFVGMAREQRAEAMPETAHIHFNGAGGNVAAGKYNDGAKDKRPLLASRLAAGMKKAWESQDRHAVDASGLGWKSVGVAMPVRDTLSEKSLVVRVSDSDEPVKNRLRAARDLSFVRRTAGGFQIPVSCLTLGEARVLHMPGELFVEYQLEAQLMVPGEFVAMAAYGDYGPGYIGTRIAYSQGGYETGPVSRVGPDVEEVLHSAMKKVLEVKSAGKQDRRGKQAANPSIDRTASDR